MKLKFSIYFLFSILLLGVATAQKRKQKGRGQISVELSEEQALKAETTFIDAEKHLMLENYEKAYELFKLANELNPANATIHYKISETLLRLGKPEESLEYINHAITLNNQNKYFYIFKADLLKAQNRYSEVAQVYEDLVKLPGNEYYYYELASIYQYQNRLDDALAAFEQGESHFGKSEMVTREKQKIYLKKSDMESLIKDWDELIAENPAEPRYVLELSSLLLANNMIEEATQRLERFNKDFPDNAGAALLLTEIERNKGNFTEAVDYLEVGIGAPEIPLMSKLQLLNSFVDVETVRSQVPTLLEALEEAHSDEFEAIAFIGDAHYRLGNESEALNYYRKSIAMETSNFTVWQQVVAMEMQNSEYDSVIVHCEQALERYPNQSVFYFYNGVALYTKEEFNHSIQMLEQGKKYTSDPSLLSVFHAQLGDAYNSINEYSKSDAAYEKSLELNSDNDHVLNNYAYFLSLRGEKLEKAKGMSGQLVEKYPDNSTYLDTYGWVLYVMGDYIEAEKYLRKAADLGEDGTIVEHLGDVLFKLGQEDEALEQWKKAKELGGVTDNLDKKINDRRLYE